MSEQESDGVRYRRLLHAMQSGVAFTMPETYPVTGHIPDAHGCSPKHLRVGVNAAMSDNAALVLLLISKGVITMPEYEKAIADQMQREVDAYTKQIATERGVNVRLA